jgi:hypothetical protein
MMTPITRTIVASIGLAFAVAACGGSVGVTPVASAHPTPAAGGSGNALFVVKIPRAATASSGSKRPAYLTPQVQGIDFTVSSADGSLPSSRGYVFYALTPQSAYCTSGPAALTCTLPVQAYPGDDLFTVNTYDQPDPTGVNSNGSSYIVSTGSVVATIASNATNTIAIATSGVVKTVLIGLDTPFPATGTPTTQPVHVTGLDADGNVIVGNFDQPLSLADSDTTGATSLSTGSIPSSGAAATLSYTGAALSAAASISASTASPNDPFNGGPFLGTATFHPGSTALWASPAYLTFSGIGAAAQTVTIGGTAAIYQSYSGCGGAVTVTGSAPTYTITPKTPGSNCNLQFSYAGTAPVTIPIYIGSN